MFALNVHLVVVKKKKGRDHEVAQKIGEFAATSTDPRSNSGTYLKGENQILPLSSDLQTHGLF